MNTDCLFQQMEFSCQSIIDQFLNNELKKYFNGRFQTAEIMDVKAEGLDIYNTMLTAMNAHLHLGPNKRKHQSIGKIRI